THFLDPATGKTRPNSVEVIPGVMVFSPDGQYLAGSNLDRQTIGVWEVASGRSRVLIPDKHGAAELAFSLDGKTLAATSKDGPILLWNAFDGRQQGTLPAG